MHKIARKYDVALEHLAWANKLPIALAVEPGTKLRVPLRRILPAKPPANGLVVNLPERGAYLFREGKFVKFYPMSIGMVDPAKFRSPVGLYKITETLKNPDWHAPKWAKSKVKIVKAGKNNPLGDRWIGTSAPGIGFHSTKDPVGVGEAKSHGCFRMAPNDIHELFERVTPGQAVRIDYQPFRLGVDKKTGQYLCAAFPDVYKKGNVEEKAVQMLGQGAVSPRLVDRAALKRAVKNATGVPVALSGKPVSVKVNGDKHDGAVAANGMLLLSTQLARTLGLKVAWEKPGQTLKVSQGNTTRKFGVNQAAGAMFYGNKVLVPARSVLDSFDMAYTYDAAKGTMVIQRDAD